MGGGGGGGMAPLCILAIPVTVVQPWFVNGGKAREPKRLERGEGCGPSHGGEIFQNLRMKLTFSCTLDTIIMGSLCTGIETDIFLHIKYHY